MSGEEYRAERQQAEREDAAKWERAKKLHELRIRNEIAKLGEARHKNIVSALLSQKVFKHTKREHIARSSFTIVSNPKIISTYQLSS